MHLHSVSYAKTSTRYAIKLNLQKRFISLQMLLFETLVLCSIATSFKNTFQSQEKGSNYHKSDHRKHLLNQHYRTKQIFGIYCGVYSIIYTMGLSLFHYLESLLHIGDSILMVYWGKGNTEGKRVRFTTLNYFC